MNRRRARRLVLAVLATVAVALTAVAAAPVFSGEQADGGPLGVEPSPTTDQTGRDLDVPTDAILLAVLLVALVGFLLQFLREPRETARGVLKFAVAGGVAVGVMAFIARHVSLEPPGANESSGAAAGNASLGTPTPGGFGEGPGGPSPLPVEHLVVIVLAGATFGVVTLLVWRSGIAQSALGLEDAGDESDIDVEEFRQVAGDAADRVEAATTARATDDAIYRAWGEMVALLDGPGPQSETPRRFEAAAVDAGMDPDDVTTLTRAFEAVRYGDATLSEARREQVIAAFRRLEAAHGDSGSRSDADQSSDGGAE